MLPGGHAAIPRVWRCCVSVVHAGSMQARLVVLRCTKAGELVVVFCLRASLYVHCLSSAFDILPCILWERHHLPLMIDLVDCELCAQTNFIRFVSAAGWGKERVARGWRAVGCTVHGPVHERMDVPKDSAMSGFEVAA